MCLWPCCFLSLLLLVSGQTHNATLSNIEIYPCQRTVLEDVSLYKSDIYTVLNNVSYCGADWESGATNGFRVHTEAFGGDNFTSTPVVFVGRQQRDGIVSWNIPLQPFGFTVLFTQVNRTVCPIRPDHPTNTPLLYIDVFSSSPTPINYTISVEAVKDFEIKIVPMGDDPGVLTIVVGASAPQILYVEFPDDVEVLTIQANSTDNKCAFISIQNNTCPVNDLLSTATSLGVFQTMSTTAFLTAKASEFNDREFLIIVITTNFSVCHGKGYVPVNPLDPLNSTVRFEQILDLQVKPLPPPETFGFAIALPILIFLGVGIVGLLIPFFCCPQVYWIPIKPWTWSCCQSKDQMLLSDEQPGYKTMDQAAQNTVSDSGSDTEDFSEPKKQYEESLEISAMVEEDESKLKLPRMCKQRHRKMKSLYSVYSWNTITIGIFYALPAFQLVISEQQILNTSGNQDKCYYNFKCAYPIWVFSAFNNIFSNIGYVLLGAFFIVVVIIRNLRYSHKRKKDREYLDSHGVPQYFGIYYAMGIALITEGFMSAFYHICPTNANFQFDTAFMFIIGGLFLVKVFQNRHPDVHANAFVAFFSFAVIIFFTLIGIYIDQVNPVAVRLVIFLMLIGLVLLFFTSFYHFHKWNISKETVLRVAGNLKGYFTKCPNHRGRFFKLLVAFIINIVLVIVVVVFHDAVDIASSVLAFFLVNLLYFIVLYTLQKLWYREHVTILPLILPVFIALFWGSAFYFFGHTVSNWKATPAESRELNQECVLLGFYDNHDIWHFLSATAMFFSFLFMLVLDDGVADVKRRDLHIF